MGRYGVVQDLGLCWLESLESSLGSRYGVAGGIWNILGSLAASSWTVDSTVNMSKNGTRFKRNRSLYVLQVMFDRSQ